MGRDSQNLRNLAKNGPELLAPAGDMDRLHLVMSYGADAVYLGGQKFGLRSAATNFSHQQLKQAVEFAHHLDRKVYVVLNSFLHDHEIDELQDYILKLKLWQVDAVICSDLGVIKLVQKCSGPAVHLSTQASCTNSQSALFWRDCGVQRIVLGREVSLLEAEKIKSRSGLELEMFIHGAMCMAYSGHCVISNYTAGRDSNRGGCAQSCRFDYKMTTEEGESRRATFMSSKDLQGLEALPQFISAGIDSLKIEGRMKGPHYAGTVTKVYAEALSLHRRGTPWTERNWQEWTSELAKLKSRDATTGNLLERARESSIFEERNQIESEYQVCGVVLPSLSQDALLQVRAPFQQDDELELMPVYGQSLKFKANEMERLHGEKISSAKPGQVIRLSMPESVTPWTIIRKKIRPREYV